MSTMLDDGASTASIPSPTHWYDDPQRALGAELVEILTRTPFVLVLAYYVGKAFAKARLPRISGYLVTGVVCGSHVLGILGRGATRRLAGLDNLCLAVIGVAAGSELHLADLRRSPKPTLIMTAAITAFSWAFVFITFCVVAPASNLDFLPSPRHVVAVGSLAATLSVARSPASAIAVLREMEGRGPFCSLVMSVTVVKDVLVVVMFAVNLELVAAARLDFSAGGGAGGGAGNLGNRVASSPSPYGSSNFWAVLRTIAKEEGAWALTRGLGPRVLFHIPAGAISWGTYEAGKRMLGITGGGHHH